MAWQDNHIVASMAELSSIRRTHSNIPYNARKLNGRVK